MRGSYKLVVKNKRVIYNIELERNITIIKGNSGTGKTNLLLMLEDYLNNGKSSGVHVSTNIASFFVLKPRTNWEDLLYKNKNVVYFADEDVQYILTKKFCDLLSSSGSYLVYITRTGRTGYLQYSISSLKYFKNISSSNIYTNILCDVYSDSNFNFKPDLVLTEDSTSGLSILEHGLDVQVKSSFGKDAVVNKLIQYSKDYTNIYIIVDGAAFGNQISQLMSTIKALTSCNVCVFAPESFEYLILNTQQFRSSCIDELTNTSKYVDSEIFKTWEKFYEYLLVSKCKDLGIKYEKVTWDNLHHYFKSKVLVMGVVNQLYDLDASIKNYRQ